MSQKDHKQLSMMLRSLVSLKEYIVITQTKATYHFADMAEYAMIMWWTVLGYAASRLSEEEKALHPHINWSELSELKDFISMYDAYAMYEKFLGLNETIDSLHTELSKIEADRQPERWSYFTSTDEFIVTLRKMRAIKAAYYRLTDPRKFTENDFNHWIEGLQEPRKSKIIEKGLEECRHIPDFIRHVLERRDVGMDEYFRHNLSDEDYEKYISKFKKIM